MVLRGCLLGLSMLAVLAGGYAYWFDQQFERPASLVFGVIVGFIAYLCLASLYNARTAWRDWRLLSAESRDLTLSDGELMAVCGTIQPLGDPLIAPFSGRPCVLCEYDLTRPRRAGQPDPTGSDYAGFLMTPSFIRGPWCQVRLLGYPVVEQEAERRCHGYLAAWNARNFLASHTFENRTGLKLVTAISAFDEIWSDDDGRVEKNMQLGRVAIDDLFPPESLASLERLALQEKATRDDDPGDEADNDHDDHEPRKPDRATATRPYLSIPKMVEKRVRVGEQVCIIGVYNAERGGLLPPGARGPVNRLLRGSPEKLRARLRTSTLRQLAAGIVGLVLLHLVLAAVFALQT